MNYTKEPRRCKLLTKKIKKTQNKPIKQIVPSSILINDTEMQAEIRNWSAIQTNTFG